MDAQLEKIYVAVGNDIQDTYKTLEWALKKWKSHSISIVILHISSNNITKDFVHTPFGKLPSSSVSEDKLEVLRKYEEQKTDKLLSKYKAFCGKVKVEVLKVEKSDDPIQIFIVDLISRVQITKLVMGISFMKSSSWRSKSGISSSLYVHQHKPNFCELYIICGGKMVFLMEKKDEGIKVEGQDDQEGGIMVNKMKEKGIFKNWFGKRILSENSTNSMEIKISSKSCLSCYDYEKKWENYGHEMESYFKELLSLNLDEEVIGCEEDINDVLVQTSSPIEIDVLQHMKGEEKIANLKRKIDEANQMIQMKNKETTTNVERYAKAQRFICLCNKRVDELEDQIKLEFSDKIAKQTKLDEEKEQVQKLQTHLDENKKTLISITQNQSELSDKLQSLKLTKIDAETTLEKVVSSRSEAVRMIEDFRRQRDILNRRIEFCKEKIGKSTRSSFKLSCGYKEYTFEDVRLATKGFSNHLKMKSSDEFGIVYKGRIGHLIVAIHMFDSVHGFSSDEFQAKVKLSNEIRHPHLLAMIGFCNEPKCIIYEYMHNGNLKGLLSTSKVISNKRHRTISWHDRIRIAHEICSSLGFLHFGKPTPFIHKKLNPSNIFLDNNLVSKLSTFDIVESYKYEDESKFDIHGFGVLLFNLLGGEVWARNVEDEKIMMMMMMNDEMKVTTIFDEMDVKWPLDLGKDVFELAMRCLFIDRVTNIEFGIGEVMKELDGIKKRSDDIIRKEGFEEEIKGCEYKEVTSDDIPSVFLCPIFQEVMKNPHIAADGFSYELEAIEEWLRTGHDTSPMTNLRLNHTFLTPNYSLRYLFQDWQLKSSSSIS